MKLEKQEELFKKYPTLFQDKDKPMTETCMCWGISVNGDGWYDILDKLCEFLSQYDVVFLQVKEKYGGLRIYTRSVPMKDADAIWTAISKAENESYKTCEFCGTKENVWSDKVGWIHTACQNCREKKELPTYKYTDEEINEIEKSWEESGL